MHILVPIDPGDLSRAAPLAALQLASGAGALVTLLHVHDRCPEFTPTVQLDALSNLQLVLQAPPHVVECAPVFPDNQRRLSLQRLRALGRELESSRPEEVRLSLAWRQGNPLAETLAYVEESGVDVVVLPAPAACRSPMLRRFARELPPRCTCEVHIVHPSRSARGERSVPGAAAWRRFLQRWTPFWRPGRCAEPEATQPPA